jgi:hypothetical protein
MRALLFSFLLLGIFHFVDGDSKPFYLSTLISGRQTWLRMNSVNYAVAVCDPNAVNVQAAAATFTILTDGRIQQTADSYSGATPFFAKAPLESSVLSTNSSSLYNYLRFGADNPGGYTEITFSNNSGLLGWNNAKFYGGTVHFGVNPTAITFVGWIRTLYYVAQTFPSGTSTANLTITDVDSIPVPGRSAFFDSTTSSTNLFRNFMLRKYDH